MKGGKYARTLAKNQFFGTFHIRAVSEEMFCQIHRDLYGDAMMAVLPDGTKMADENKQKLFCYRVLLQKREFIPRRTHKH